MTKAGGKSPSCFGDSGLGGQAQSSHEIAAAAGRESEGSDGQRPQGCSVCLWWTWPVEQTPSLCLREGRPEALGAACGTVARSPMRDDTEAAPVPRDGCRKWCTASGASGRVAVNKGF